VRFQRCGRWRVAADNQHSRRDADHDHDRGKRVDQHERRVVDVDDPARAAHPPGTHDDDDHPAGGHDDDPPDTADDRAADDHDQARRRPAAANDGRHYNEFDNDELIDDEHFHVNQHDVDDDRIGGEHRHIRIRR
jgi:hypothetical protein